MNLHLNAPKDFEVHPDRPANIRVIEIVPSQMVTRQSIEAPRTEHGQVVPDVERDILKLVVVERHRATGNVGVGFVRRLQAQGWRAGLHRRPRRPQRRCGRRRRRRHRSSCGRTEAAARRPGRRGAGNSQNRPSITDCRPCIRPPAGGGNSADCRCECRRARVGLRPGCALMTLSFLSLSPSRNSG